jgi:hypothetical protein
VWAQVRAALDRPADYRVARKQLVKLTEVVVDSQREAHLSNRRLCGFLIRSVGTKQQTVATARDSHPHRTSIETKHPVHNSVANLSHTIW